MTLDASDSLLQALREHNPWWDEGTAAFSLPSRHKSDFYHLARPAEATTRVEDQPLFALVGRRGVGKTTLLHAFVHHQINAGVPPEGFLYLPFDADPLYQLRSDDQLRQAVRYYDSRIRGRIDRSEPAILLLDDVHRIEHPNKPTVDGWGTVVTELLADAPDRHVVVTASAGEQITRELDRVDVEADQYDIQTVLPEKFRDYIFTLYPDLEEGETRVSPSSLRAGDRSLPATLETGDVDGLVAELRSKYDQIAPDTRRIRSQVVEYLAMGGIISYDRDGVVRSASTLTADDYERLRRDLRAALYQQIPDFESIKTIADLERLCALAAKNRSVEPIRYQELVDLFDVDRRTIADSYLSALADLYILTGVTEYDNSRPRSVRLYLRDPGLITALGTGDASTVRTNLDYEADLARVAAFDHTMRFAYGVTAKQGSESIPSVQYWHGRTGEVPFVFELDGTPVPIGLAYRPGEREETLATVREFSAEYDAPVGLVLSSEMDRQSESIEEVSDGVIELPYWFYLLLC